MTAGRPRGTLRVVGQAAQEAGIQADGPIPADTLFPKARGGAYDVAVAMYHDQGHIPVKLAGFVWDDARRDWQPQQGHPQQTFFLLNETIIPAHRIF